MNKKLLLAVAVILVLISGGYYFYSKNLPSGQITTSNGQTVTSYIAHTEPMYRNEKWGFQVNVPATWTRYEVRESKHSEDNIIDFALPLQGNKISDLLGEPEKSARVINIEWLDFFNILKKH